MRSGGWTSTGTAALDAYRYGRFKQRAYAVSLPSNDPIGHREQDMAASCLSSSGDASGRAGRPWSVGRSPTNAVAHSSGSISQPGRPRALDSHSGACPLWWGHRKCTGALDRSPVKCARSWGLVRRTGAISAGPPESNGVGGPPRSPKASTCKSGTGRGSHDSPPSSGRRSQPVFANRFSASIWYTTGSRAVTSAKSCWSPSAAVHATLRSQPAHPTSNDYAVHGC